MAFFLMSRIASHPSSMMVKVYFCSKGQCFWNVVGKIKVIVKKALSERILSKSTKLMGSGKFKLMTKQVKEAAKQLRDVGIIIRRAGKASPLSCWINTLT